MYEIRQPVALSLQSLSLTEDTSMKSVDEAPTLIQDKMKYLEKELRRLDMTCVAADDSESVMQLDAYRSKLLQRLTRCRLYQAAMIMRGVNGRIEFSVSSAETMVSCDASYAASLNGFDEADSCRIKAECLLNAAESRLNTACVQGWLFRGDALEGFLETLLNGYIQELYGLFNNLMSTELHSLNIRSRRQFVECYFDNHNRFEFLLGHQLAILGYCAMPAPRLSLSLDQESLIRWYSSSVKEVYKYHVESVFEIWKRRSQNVQMPWKVNRVWNSRRVAKYLQTSIPEDCIAHLMEILHDSHVSCSEAREEFDTLICNMNSNVDILFVESLSLIAQNYLDAISSRNWLECGSMDVEEGRLHDRIIGWIFSIVNDISRIQIADSLNVAVAQITVSGNHDRRAILKLEKVENAHEVFEKCYVIALDYLSCVIFENIFHDFELEWPNLNIESPIKSAVAVLLNLWPAFNAAMTDSYSFARLLLICADKIVMLFLAMIRDGGVNFVLKMDEDLLKRWNEDVKMVFDAFTNASKVTGCDKYLCLIELRLRRLSDVFNMIAADLGDDVFRSTLKKITDEGVLKRNESLAFANMIRSCLRARRFVTKLDESISSSIRALEAVYERPLPSMVYLSAFTDQLLL